MIADNTILLVDDDLDVLFAYKSLLEDDYHVCIENNPANVLAKIATDWIGVVVSDVSMPEISGVGITRTVTSSG